MAFLDIDLDDDNLLFIDPRLIEISSDDYSIEMQKNIETFWSELIKFVKSKDIINVYKILSGMKEPNETKLGYATSKKSGNSISDKIKPKLVEAIQNNRAVQSGILSHFADVELFIKDISSDRISDITTKIIKKVLIDFTADQCKTHGIPLKKFTQDDIFNPLSKKWERGVYELPSHDGKPIIFVPKHIVRLENSANKNMSSFYRFAIRHFIAHDKDMIEDVSPTGKDGQLLLRDVKSKYPLSKDSMSNWMLKYGKMLVDYKSDVLNGRIRPLTDDEISEIVYKDLLSKAS
ncbi:hypothetical protein [Flavobacterium sp.]|uniref:hypothetical protein n=1 Tax=Flavobacterium sp. TaxID=239 RepID=UPI00260DA7E7|nr:hypothetical protein [Flavobacterium sp.]